MPFFSVLIDLLSDRDQFIQEIYDGIKVNTKIFGLLVCSSIFLAIYGGLIGAVSSWMQVLSSAAKLPFLFLITLAICLPALYFFNVYFGAKTRLSQYTAILLCAVTITSTLLFGFAPVTLFFLITTDSYSFFLLLNGKCPIAYKRMSVVGFGLGISSAAGIREGCGIPSRAARQDCVRKSKIERPCNFKE